MISGIDFPAGQRKDLLLAEISQLESRAGTDDPRLLKEKGSEYNGYRGLWSRLELQDDWPIMLADDGETL